MPTALVESITSGCPDRIMTKVTQDVSKRTCLESWGNL